MPTKHAEELRPGEVLDYTPWCEEGTTATVVVRKVRPVKPHSVSVTTTMLTVDGATQDRWGIEWSNSRILMLLDSDQEIRVL